MSCLANVPLSSARSRRLRRARLCLRDGSAYTSFLRIRTLGSSRQSKLWGGQQQTRSVFNCGERRRRTSRLPVSSLWLHVGRRKKAAIGNVYILILIFFLTDGRRSHKSSTDSIKCGLLFLVTWKKCYNMTPPCISEPWNSIFKALSFHVLCCFASIGYWNYLFCFANTQLNQTFEAFTCGRTSCYNFLKLMERRMKKRDTKSVERCIPLYYILNILSA